jgi:archaellin
MRRILSRRPSPAIIIAIVALVAALAGTAIAGGGFVTKTKFKKFKQSTNTNLSSKVSGPITYVNQTQSVNTNTGTSTNGVNITAACPAGQHAVGGGVKSALTSQQSGLFVEYSYPSASGWTANVFAGTGAPPGTPEQITVTAVCEGGTTSGTPPSITP